MWPKAASLLLIVLLSSSLTSGVRRKSKIDLPIANAADAPPNDNIALASSTNEATKFEEQPSAQALSNTEKPVNLAAAAVPAVASAPAQTQSAQSNSLPSPAAVSSPLVDNSVSSGENEAIECDPDMIGFEIITGYVFKRKMMR